jgi:hypothetical protein
MLDIRIWAVILDVITANSVYRKFELCTFRTVILVIWNSKPGYEKLELVLFQITILDIRSSSFAYSSESVPLVVISALHNNSGMKHVVSSKPHSNSKFTTDDCFIGLLLLTSQKKISDER